ncbi:S8 family serine peptidase [Hamadaea tsunoensis]|uniref:S8 family serine peptidase n=1 Tax=Hamadaea tsunoensis TaxID=53368 RepID=UPI0004889CEC|nr:S8 family serine peptidase [Hamadaea tsunoensis]
MQRSRHVGGAVRSGLALAFTVGLLLAGVPAGATPAPVGHAGAAAPTAAAVAHAGQVRRVTLITGDVVEVSGAQAEHLSIHPAAGRSKITFDTYRLRGHQHVVPADALPMLRSGRIDARLFDVTDLLTFGYDDRRADLPLIVAEPSGAVTAPADAGLTFGPALKAVKGHAAKARKDKHSTLWKSITGTDKRSLAKPLTGAKIWLDGVRKPALDVSVPLIGAPDAWAAGYTGAGAKVAVLDTGLDSTHPDLGDAVLDKKNFVTDFPDESDDLDHVGHGTHVASIITGNGAASGGKYKGVAPDAKLLIGKVCVQYGCDESWILAGMQWAAESGADVVNMSLGGGDSPEIDPLEQAVNDLTAAYGTLFVIAAGNDGDFGDSTLGSPSTADAALSVAATDKSDALASFSSRGPRVGDYAVKPDIAAPGVDITAARSKDGFLGEPGEMYMSLSGTSMATPHVAGAAAILVSEHPDWTPAQLKAALMASAKPLDGVGAFGDGAGRVDLTRAIHQQVTVDELSLSFGLAQWPHSDDPAVTKTVTYRNSGTAAVTLNLAVHSVGPDGHAAPAGMFTLSASTVSVPAGGTASVTLTSNTAVSANDGLYSGQLVGTADGVSVSTPFGVDREVESYDLTINHTQRDGAPSEDHLTILASYDGPLQYLFGSGARQTIRVPAGTYVLNSWINDGLPSVSMLVNPKLVVSGDQTIEADARNAKPTSIRVPFKGLTPALTAVDATVTGNGWTSGFSALADDPSAVFTQQLGGSAPLPNLMSSISLAYAKTDADGSFLNTPTVAAIAYFTPGTFYTGITKNVTMKSLATQRQTFHVGRPGAQGSFMVMPTWKQDPFSGSWSAGFYLNAPNQRTTYVNTDGDAAFQANYEEFNEDYSYDMWLTDAIQSYQGGKTYPQDWNAPAFGPSFAAKSLPWDYATREGDALNLNVPLFSDGAGHAGFGVYTAGYAHLYRDGTLLAADEENPFLYAEAPPQDSAYRLELGATRDGTKSPKVSGVWTFRSKHVPAGDGSLGSGVERLPLTAIGFAPVVDGQGNASAAFLAPVPVTVSTQGKPATLAKLTVQVSTDGGTTWRDVVLVHLGPTWLAFVPQPKGADISLRTHGVDKAGQTVDETIIGAYHVK